MSESEQKTDIVFEKYYPQHPLPNEIKQLPSKETICQFCGISYLIHSEIKRLEEEIIFLNKKIKNFEELEINEKKFEKQYNDVSKEIEHLQKDYLNLNEKFTQTRSERDRLQEQSIDKDDAIAKLESSLLIFKVDRDKFINTQNLLVRDIFKLQNQMRSMREEFSSSKKHISSVLLNGQSEYSVFMSKVRTTLDQIKHCLAMTDTESRDKLNHVSLELATAKGVIAEKDGQIDDNVAKFQGIVEKNRGLIQKNNEQEHKLADTVSHIIQKDDIIQMLKCEIDQLRASKNDQINNVNDEITVLRVEKKKLSESLLEMSVSNEKLQLSLTDHQTEIQRLLAVIEEKDHQLTVSRDIIVLGEGQIRSYLQQIESMTEERDKEIAHYRAELSKLTNDFKKKEKYSEINKHELENSHQRKMAQKEVEVIQLQKSEGIKDKKLSEEFLENERLQNVIKNTEIQNQKLVKKLDELQKHLDLEKKKISRKSEEEEQSIQELEKEIVAKESLIDKMEDDLIKRNNEITSLKQMVERECDERSELTKALDQARTQLLLMGDYHVSKLPNNLPNNLPPINHAKSSSSSASDTRHSTFTRKEKRNSLDKLSASSKNSIISTKRKLEQIFNK